MPRRLPRATAFEPGDGRSWLPRRLAGHGFLSFAERGLRYQEPFAESGPARRECSAEHGFTLIELMVALAVFSIAALALLRLEGATVAQTATLADRAIGQIVARNIAVEALTERSAPPRGLLNGEEENAGRKWLWVRTVTPTSDPRVQRIDVAVTDDGGHRAGTLTVFRLSLT